MKNPFRGGGMDIFWNHTLLLSELGDSRKYPCHTMDGFLEFRGQGGSLNWKSEGMGGYLRLEFRRHGGVLDLGFPQETDKSVFLENANFMDF